MKNISIKLNRKSRNTTNVTLQISAEKNALFDMVLKSLAG